ncbi:hypothetical protein CPB83DRAFT_949056 [Crepidotus variabilis]|uniref:Uncharacterized protein n=1 Tax=Crepidotus variabilis TaxID=179855 RepID=A0A9P6JK73_9AGAR|nr:hypothetical protein CPB83DRAFT_949056 [Crepidotus variabilis]
MPQLDKYNPIISPSPWRARAEPEPELEPKNPTQIHCTTAGRFFYSITLASAASLFYRSCSPLVANAVAWIWRLHSYIKPNASYANAVVGKDTDLGEYIDGFNHRSLKESSGGGPAVAWKWRLQMRMMKKMVMKMAGWCGKNMKKRCNWDFEACWGLNLKKSK